jgi:hypothetical protein
MLWGQVFRQGGEGRRTGRTVYLRREMGLDRGRSVGCGLLSETIPHNLINDLLHRLPDKEVRYFFTGFVYVPAIANTHKSSFITTFVNK